MHRYERLSRTQRLRNWLWRRRVYRWLGRRRVYQWTAWRVLSTWRIIRDHAKHESNWCLTTRGKISISFKCWLAVMLGRELKDKHFPEDTPDWHMRYPDGVAVAMFDYHYYSGSLDSPDGHEWDELCYIREDGIRLRYTVINQST